MALDVTTLENWLWDAACAIRGPMDAPKFKDYILPLVFLKRLSDVFEDEVDRLTEEFGSRDVAARIVEDERERGTIAGSRGSVRFYIPENARWSNIRRQTTGLGQYLTDAVRAVACENPQLQGVIDLVDFNATTAEQRIVINRKKRRPGEILFVNAAKLFAKGRTKNYLADEHIETIARLYHQWQAEEGLSAVITNEEAARNDYNLSPSRYVATNNKEEVLPLEEAVVLLREAEEERAEANRKLNEVLKALGLT